MIIFPQKKRKTPNKHYSIDEMVNHSNKTTGNIHTITTATYATLSTYLINLKAKMLAALEKIL